MLLVLLTAFGAWAQIQQHDSWSYEVSKKEVKTGETVDLIFKVSIDANWYMYSSDFSPEVGPTVTTFQFTKDPSYQLVGGIKAIKPKVKYDSIFEGTVKYFVGTATFRQTVKVLQPKLNIKGSANFQVCSEVSGQCIPGDVDFSFDNKLIKVSKAETTKPDDTKKTKKNDDKEEADNKKDDEKTEDRDKKDEKKDSSNTDTTNKDTLAGNTAESNTDNNTTPDNTVATNQTQNGTTDKPTDKSAGSLLWLFIGAFGAGLLALVTPCVFPMIPMTVTFFTKQSKTRKEGIFKASVYGASIVGIYTLIGTLVAVLFGVSFANWLSTHWVPNLIFFVVFFIFALSFLGMFEIVLPSSWVNKIDSKADKGGIAGVFFMAFTLVLVSFSCTGPVVGSVLIESVKGEVIRPVVGMLGFSLAIALPFTLFALFPSWLNSLPKSGGWLNNVKVVLGFVELALALKFLSVIDQVYHLELLNRDVYLAAWIVIFSMVGFYLLGKLRMPHDSPVEKISVPKAVLAVATFSFVVYMIPGMFGAPLDGLAGYLPPQNTQTFDMHRVNRKLEQNERKLEKLVEALQNGNVQLANNSRTKDSKVDFSKVKHSGKLHLPHDLKGFFDYKEALAYAKKVGKPIFIDFTGHGCVNCRKMEQSVWAAAPVLKRLEEDYVVVALYVDDKTLLPESEWYTSPYDKKVKKTIGAQNFDFQVSKFNGNAQPYYCLLDPATEELLVRNTPGYDPDVDKFVKFLDAGLSAFKAKSKKDNNAMARK